MGRGDHVGIYSHNRSEFLEAMLGCWKIGAVAVNVNYRYVADELRYLVDDADLVAMVAERTFVPLLDELVPEFPDLSAHVLLDDGADHEPAGFEATPYEEALAAATAGRDFGVPRSADDRYLLYTGGTTGMPKGVMWRHEDVFFACFGGGNYFDPISTPEQIADNGTDPPAADLAARPGSADARRRPVDHLHRPLLRGQEHHRYTERSFDAHEVLRLIDRERPMTVAFVGDAMARPVAEAALDPSPATTSRPSSRSATAARCSPRRSGPRSSRPSRTPSSPTATAPPRRARRAPRWSRRATRRAPSSPSTTRRRCWTTTSGPSSRAGTGMFARTGHIPLGYYKDPEKTAATFRTDADGRALGDPR